MSTNTAAQQQQPAVIYARVYCEEQVQGYSIQAKLRAWDNSWRNRYYGWSRAIRNRSWFGLDHNI